MEKFVSVQEKSRSSLEFFLNKRILLLCENECNSAHIEVRIKVGGKRIKIDSDINQFMPVRQSLSKKKNGFIRKTIARKRQRIPPFSLSSVPNRNFRFPERSSVTMPVSLSASLENSSNDSAVETNMNIQRGVQALQLSEFNRDNPTAASITSPQLQHNAAQDTIQSSRISHHEQELVESSSIVCETLDVYSDDEKGEIVQNKSHEMHSNYLKGCICFCRDGMCSNNAHGSISNINCHNQGKAFCLQIDLPTTEIRTIAVSFLVSFLLDFKLKSNITAPKNVTLALKLALVVILDYYCQRNAIQWTRIPI